MLFEPALTYSWFPQLRELNKIFDMCSFKKKQKTKNEVIIWPSNPTVGHIPCENHNFKRHMYPSVHCSTIYNSQDMEATLMSIDR